MEATAWTIPPSEHRFPVRHLLRSKTLPELVTPLKGYTLYLRAAVYNDDASALRKVSLSGTFLQNSARIGYATEGALFVSVHSLSLYNDDASALRKVWVLIRLWKQRIVQART